MVSGTMHLQDADLLRSTLRKLPSMSASVFGYACAVRILNAFRSYEEANSFSDLTRLIEEKYALGKVGNLEGLFEAISKRLEARKTGAETGSVEEILLEDAIVAFDCLHQSVGDTENGSLRCSRISYECVDALAALELTGLVVDANDEKSIAENVLVKQEVLRQERDLQELVQLEEEASNSNIVERFLVRARVESVTDARS